MEEQPSDDELRVHVETDTCTCHTMTLACSSERKYISVNLHAGIEVFDVMYKCHVVVKAAADRLNLEEQPSDDGSIDYQLASLKIPP